MKLHSTDDHADWATVPPQDRNVWQRVAADSNGILTPGNGVSLFGILLVVGGLLVMSVGKFWLGLSMVGIGRIADIFDGMVADRTGTKGPVGEAVDAITDKAAAITVLIFFIYFRWIPVLPVLCVVAQVGVNGLLAITARLRHVALHPNAAGKLATVCCWVALLAFPAAAAARRADLHVAYGVLALFAYALTLVFVVLTAQAVVVYYRRATAGLKQPVKSTIVFCVTALRIVCAVLIVVAAKSSHWLPLLPLALLAFVSDFLDGWLARRWRVVSTFGMAFDPLADKIVCLTLLAVAAVYIEGWYWVLFALFAVYDVFTMTMRFVSSRPMPASKTAKLKTALLMVGLVAMILGKYTPILAFVAAVLLAVAAVLTLQSLRGYTRALGRSMEWLEHDPGVSVIDFETWHKRHGIRAVLFDIEGTLTPWADPTVDDVVASAMKHARKVGIEHVGLVSNMHPRNVARAAAVADQITAGTYHVPTSRNERKPSPVMIHTALAVLGVRVEEAGFVGDKIIDVLAARRAGVARVAWVDRLGKADHPFDRIVYRPIERVIKWAIK
ncbi:MAG TPA: CDP-alcohol phosphatidyltransferase family protein [Verrucomicrobiae bacterium]|nr:CDP-alcohol phosphatidyltransferase family protein [Verrucomicrobiae bacterium]